MGATSNAIIRRDITAMTKMRVSWSGPPLQWPDCPGTRTPATPGCGCQPDATVSIGDHARERRFVSMVRGSPQPGRWSQESPQSM